MIVATITIMTLVVIVVNILSVIVRSRRRQAEKMKMKMDMRINMTMMIKNNDEDEDKDEDEYDYKDEDGDTDKDTDGDGDFDVLYSYGGRSFTIWSTSGTMIYDSGDVIGRKTFELNPSAFNNDEGDVDDRSDDKGAEPEAVTTLKMLDKTLLFVGLERTGGVLVFNISNPQSPEFIDWILDETDVAPEGLIAIPASKSPNGNDLIVVTNEVSNTVSIFELKYVTGISKIFKNQMSCLQHEEMNIQIWLSRANTSLGGIRSGLIHLGINNMLHCTIIMPMLQGVVFSSFIVFSIFWESFIFSPPGGWRELSPSGFEPGPWVDIWRPLGPFPACPEPQNRR